MCYHHLQGFKTQGINSIELIVRELKKIEECITSLGEEELTRQPTKLGGCYLVIYNNGWSQIGKAFKLYNKIKLKVKLQNLKALKALLVTKPSCLLNDGWGQVVYLMAYPHKRGGGWGCVLGNFYFCF
jgi:hypothetical protein